MPGNTVDLLLIIVAVGGARAGRATDVATVVLNVLGVR